MEQKRVFLAVKYGKGTELSELDAVKLMDLLKGFTVSGSLVDGVFHVTETQMEGDRESGMVCALLEPLENK